MPCALRPPRHPGDRLAREGLLVERTLTGDDQVGAGQGRIEADEVEHDVDPRAALGAEHGEQGEPDPTGSASPRLLGRIRPIGITDVGMSLK